MNDRPNNPKSIPNPLILFANHFDRFRRHYPTSTKLEVAADLGYDGYEFQPIEPEDDESWREALHAAADAGMKTVGMYVVATGATDEDAPGIDEQIRRVEGMVERLSEFGGKRYLNLTIGGNPSPGSSIPHESGSVRAQTRHWERAARIVQAADRALGRHRMQGNLYNHIWFMTDTPQAQVKLLELAGAEVIRPGIVAIHAHLHRGVPDPVDLLRMPELDGLGYFAALNTWSAPAPFRTMPIDLGEIDFATWLGLLWDRDYHGPIILQAYDLGGDAYLSAKRSIEYVRELWVRFFRNPLLKPFAPDWRQPSR